MIEKTVHIKFGTKIDLLRYSEHNFNVIASCKRKIECIKVHVKKKQDIDPTRERPTIKLHRHCRTNYRRLRYRSYLFRRGHIGLPSNFILETILRPSYGARSVFRLQFHSLIKVSVEKFKRYGKRRVIYIPPFRTAEKPDKLGFSRNRNTSKSNNIVGAIL